MFSGPKHKVGTELIILAREREVQKYTNDNKALQILWDFPQSSYYNTELQ